MRKEYTKPTLNITDYIIETEITASANFGSQVWDEHDTEANWEDFQ